MQRFTKIVVAFCISVMCLSSVKAAKTCSNSEQAEINSMLSNIKATYAEKEEDLDPNTYGFPDSVENPDEYEKNLKTNYFEISVTNLSDKFYIIVTNDYNNETNTYSGQNAKDGIASFAWRHLDKVTNFTIKVYTSNATGCPNEEQKTIRLRTPRYNEYSEYNLCMKIPEFNLCQKYVTFKDMDNQEFVSKVYEYIDKKEEQNQQAIKDAKSWWEKTKDFIKENKYYFIGGAVGLVVVAGVAGAVIVYKRRSSEL